MAVLVDNEKCTGCGQCVDTCPVAALEVKGEVVVVDEETCIDCGACIDACPFEALSL
ncbi:MAG: 4Fe-4S binding protein [Candidatus Cloacimonetes bacterium]|nr:4Fe-4S binding protein [Candidatus Cloacimonadota bacterium]